MGDITSQLRGLALVAAGQVADKSKSARDGCWQSFGVICRAVETLASNRAQAGPAADQLSLLRDVLARLKEGPALEGEQAAALNRLVQLVLKPKQLTPAEQLTTLQLAGALRDGT